jgi:hypothetical protein
MAPFYSNGQSWRAQVCVSGVRDSKSFRTKREAQAWASSAREIEIRAPKHANPGELHTVGQILRKYGEEISPRKEGERAEGPRIKAFIRDFSELCAKTLAEFDTPDLGYWGDNRLKGYERPDSRMAKAWACARQIEIRYVSHANAGELHNICEIGRSVNGCRVFSRR